ncbi:MAG TPA: ATP-binding protein [Vicinamibacterales bacterium]|nr:ATP-binding protein [Vicinamibacterales bacterium]
MTTTLNPHAAVFLALAQAINQTRTVDDIYGSALDALGDGLGVDRASILLFDPDGVMRFKASRGISEQYRRAVEGHSPWTADAVDPQPLVVEDVTAAADLAPFLPTIVAEGIAAMAFIPLLSRRRVIGKFMLYFGAPRALSAEELQVATAIAAQIAFAVERTRTEEQARRSEERLRFALDAASMGTWDWDLTTNEVVWSDNLAAIHGLPPGTFDGSFSSYEREIHPEDRERVLASAQRAIAEAVPHDVEYRIVAPDGSIRWCVGKGRVEYKDGRPVRMSGVCMMVTRRKEAELARLAAAEEASRLKDEFLATLSHELRTPLNAILGWVQIVQTDRPGPERVKRAIEVIGRNAQLQAQLTEDILDVSRIISGKLEIERVPVSMGRLIETALTGVMPQARARGIKLTSHVAKDLPPIEGDLKRLHQVLGNVLSNAVKFTPAGGSVDLRCVAQDERLEIAVRDSGVGITPEFLPYVFDRFRQADSQTTRRHGGLGLGLAIARYFVEQHGGEIRAESPGEGRGTTITIRFPVTAPASMASRTDAPSEASTTRLDALAVMVVDDQDDSRTMLSSLFEGRGATVVECDSVSAVMEQLAARPVDLLVADIAMPDADGYELIRRVRESGHRTPAIAVTAYARPEDRSRAIAAGYAGYCAKPIDIGDLLGTVRTVLPGAAKPRPSHPAAAKRT